MRSSRHWSAWPTLLLTGGFGLLLVVVPFWPGADQGEHRYYPIPLGLAFLAVTAMVWLRWFAPSRPRDRVALVDGDGRAAFSVGLRPHIPLSVVILGVVWAGFFVWLMAVQGFSNGGLLLLPVVALFASLVPDGLRAITRRPRLRFDDHTLDYRGWGSDSQLAWEDVEQVDFAAPDVRRPVLRIQGRHGATSWTHRHLRIVYSLDQRPAGARIDVPLLALDAPGRLVTLLDDWRTKSAPERRDLIAPEGVAFLDETLNGPGETPAPS